MLWSQASPRCTAPAPGAQLAVELASSEVQAPLHADTHQHEQAESDANRQQPHLTKPRVLELRGQTLTFVARVFALAAAEQLHLRKSSEVECLHAQTKVVV